MVKTNLLNKGKNVLFLNILQANAIIQGYLAGWGDYPQNWKFPLGPNLKKLNFFWGGGHFPSKSDVLQKVRF